MLGELVIYDPFTAPFLMLLFGVVLAFFGSRLVPLALALSALVIGFFHGGSIIASFTDNALIIQWGPVAVAVLLTVIVLFVYRAAFFVAGLFIGFFAMQAFFPDRSFFIYGAAALLAGVIAYISRNFVFSVLTALMGAGLLATGAVSLLAWAGVSAGSTLYFIIAAAVAISGTFYQMRNGRKKK
jgi:hypothetical protein